jgi:hypothetical protein
MHFTRHRLGRPRTIAAFATAAALLLGPVVPSVHAASKSSTDTQKTTTTTSKDPKTGGAGRKIG